MRDTLEQMVSDAVDAAIGQFEQEKPRDKGFAKVDVLLLIMIAFCIGGFFHTHDAPVNPTLDTAGARTVMELPGPKGEEVLWNCSAYCPCELCCGVWAKKGVNAKGQRVFGDQTVITPGALVIAAPPEIPFGTTIDVPGYGRAVVRDRGGAIKGNKLDLFFNTHQEALNWGRQHLVCTF